MCLARTGKMQAGWILAGTEPEREKIMEGEFREGREQWGIRRVV